MQKTFAFILIALFFGTGFGFLLAVSTGAELESHDHGSHDHGADIEEQEEAGTGQHDHDQMIDLPDGANAPKLGLKLHAEAGGWNLQVLTQNFQFSPENVNTAHVEGEGHAHVYVDGNKIARIYGPWFHIGSLPEGAQTLSVWPKTS